MNERPRRHRDFFRRPRRGRGGLAVELTRIKVPREEACARCLRPRDDCFCERVTRVGNRVFVLILQHPQEQRKLIGSAQLARCALERSTLRVGLSWPNLSAALGGPAKAAEWGALFLKRDGQPSGGAIAAYGRRGERQGEVPPLAGIVALDGTWKQAKTLWWRNPWLLKLRRLTLNPHAPSLRPQARVAGLSTIEAIALALRELGEDPALAESLVDQYVHLVLEPAQRYLQGGAGGARQDAETRSRAHDELPDGQEDEDEDEEEKSAAAELDDREPMPDEEEDEEDDGDGSETPNAGLH